MSDPRLPNVIVAGAAKAGTTSLHHYLGQHPQVFVPDHQEPSWFAFAGRRPDFASADGRGASVNRTAVTDLDAYLRLFEPGRGHAVRCDVSPVYLYWPGTAERIAAHVPDATVCIVLRDPVDRAYSAYMHARREGREPLEDFEAALDAEPDRIREGWGFLWRYADLGRYAAQVQRYLDVFPSDQLVFRRFDDLRADPGVFVRGLYARFGIDTSVEPHTDVRYNVSGVPRSRRTYAALSTRGPLRPVAEVLVPVLGKERLRRWGARLRAGTVRAEPLAPEVRARVRERFREDVEQTAARTGLDLRPWLASG